MANKKNWLGILAMVLVFGLAAVGCDDGSTNGENNDNKNQGEWISGWPTSSVLTEYEINGFNMPASVISAKWRIYENNTLDILIEDVNSSYADVKAYFDGSTNWIWFDFGTDQRYNNSTGTLQAVIDSAWAYPNLLLWIRDKQ